MEEPELGELRSSEQPELLSLIISGGEEEEATAERSGCGEEEALANGHVVQDSGAADADAAALTPVKSPTTSYWSITEGPDHPLLLSPAPGPSAQKPKVQKASRSGLSRIPGRDHRRYYHEYWRSEYLMDFDPQRHGMICMVCGSSLATLKLSTIKRHIKQKHPDSLLWSAADKEVIRSGWESHLNLAGGQAAYGADADAAGPAAQDEEEEEEEEEEEQPGATEPQDLVAPQEQPQENLLSLSPKSVEVEEVQQEQQEQQQEEEQEEQEEEQEEHDLPGPSAQTLERYLNDSLHAWFRQEFLMEYESDAGRLLCMVCGAELPSLHLNHIKSHVLDTHPNSLVYSAEEKHCILQAWAQAHEESENSIKSEPSTKDGGVDLSAQDAEDAQADMDSYAQSDGASTQDTCLIGEDGGVRTPLRQSRRKRLRGGGGGGGGDDDPWQLRLDYMVAYGPSGQDTYCMVCSQVLRDTKVGSFRRHIQESHPETLELSQRDREAMAAAWTKDYAGEGAQSRDEFFSAAAGDANDDTSADATTPTKAAKRERARGGTPSRHSHYPGKDQRRNYQVRWRMDYLMDYDSGRHGLICIVCGATLATLKVSTIKRHIQQVHPYSLTFSPEKKQQALLSYSQSGAHVLHFDDCFTAQDFGHTELAQSPTRVHT